MIKIKGIDHINIYVRSLNSAQKFYEEHFGFKVQEDYKYNSSNDEITRFMLIGISEKMMLCLYEDPHENFDIKNSPLSHIGINVENFDEALKYADEKRILDKRWGLKSYSKSRSFYIEDPNGLTLEISELFAGGH